MKNYADMVNVYMGGVAHMTRQATMPVMALPHGMMQTYPLYNMDMPDKYFADRIYAFPAGPALLMPVGSREVMCFDDLASGFDRDLEEARPYIYRNWLQDSNVNVEYTIARHSGLIKFTFPDPAKKEFVLCVPGAAKCDFVQGKVIAAGAYQAAAGFGVYEFSSPVTGEITDISAPLYTSPQRIPDRVPSRILRLTAEGSESEVLIRFGISLIDEMQAEENLRKEIPDFNIINLAEKAKAEWNALLGKIRVEGGREEEITMFYSCLYRSMLRMINFSEYGRYYSGFDKKVHSDDGHAFYCNDGMWDTYRSAHPLQMLLEPQVHADICESYIRMFEQSGWLHDFPSQDGGQAVMLGSHTTAMFADSLAHGVGFDVNRAYKAVQYTHKEGSILPWYIGPAMELDHFFYKNGFYPALPEGEKEPYPQVHSFERRQCVAVTLEQAYDDWCAALLAKAAGNTEDEELFKNRAYNYQLLFNPENGFMCPKTADGKWVAPFNPAQCGGQGGRAYYTENNAWIYTFNVQHDIEGLIRLFGSAQALEEKLDRMFIEQYGNGGKLMYLSQYPDGTGTWGQFCMGNEPSFHVPYIYNFTGAPWKTQKRIRELIRMWFSSHPFGFCGDEDGGAMASWLVFSAMGFYPFCPGNAYYTLTSPLFDTVAITMPGGKELVITAKGTSGKSKYIKSATLNGKPHNRSYITYDDIKDGAVLNLEMAEKPNKQWGSGKTDLPPSYTASG